MQNRLVVSAAIGLTLAVAGCFGGEPSEAEMRDAVERTAKAQIEKARADMRAIAGANNPFLKNMIPTYEGFSAFKKLACVAAKDAPGHVCDFQITGKRGGGAKNVKGSFFKGDDGFEFEEIG